MAERDIAVIAGYFARCPLGGYAWQVLHYLLGFEELGFEVYFYEDTALYPDCFDPVTRTMPASCDAGVQTLSQFFAEHGLDQRWHFWEACSDRRFGLPWRDFAEAVARARLHITLAPVTRLPRLGRATRVFVDLDPGYTQIRCAAGDPDLRAFLEEHDCYFTIGEHIGSTRCPVPSGGFQWRPTRQPIVTRLWETAPPAPGAPFTTIGRWHESRRDIVFQGQRYGWSKRQEWQRFLDLPQRVAASFVLAMDVEKESPDLTLLRSLGWEIVDPLQVSANPHAYRDFIAASAGEFTTAKDLNVRLRTGWFSDRSACYLAAGRPVITQATGFESILPTGEGLFAVATVEEASAAIEKVLADSDRHRAAAKRIASEWFAASTVLSELLRGL